MTEAIKLGIKSVLEQRKEYDALNYINELEKENEELKTKLQKISDYLANDIPHELMNEATNKIWRMV